MTFETPIVFAGIWNSLTRLLAYMVPKDGNSLIARKIFQINGRNISHHLDAVRGAEENNDLRLRILEAAGLLDRLGISHPVYDAGRERWKAFLSRVAEAALGGDIDAARSLMIDKKEDWWKSGEEHAGRYGFSGISPPPPPPPPEKSLKNSRDLESSADEDDFASNPANGGAAYRLIMAAGTAMEAERIYEQFISIPYKTKEEWVVAAKGIKDSRLRGESWNDTWNNAFTHAQMYGVRYVDHGGDFTNRAIYAISEIMNEYPLDDESQ